MDLKTTFTELGFSPEDTTTLIEKFTGERAAKLSEAVTAWKNYQTLSAQLKQTDAALTQEAAEWAEVRKRDKAAADNMLKELESLRVDRARLQTSLADLATKAGIDPATLVPAKEPVKDAVIPPVDLTNYVDRTTLGQVSSALFENQFELAAINAEHQVVFGKPLTAAEIRALDRTLVDRIKNKQPAELRVVWEETHGVVAQREKLDKDRYDAAIKEAETRGRNAALSETRLPSAHVGHTDRPSPALHRLGVDGKGPESALKRPQPGRTAQSAAQALREGKYRPKAGAPA